MIDIKKLRDILEQKILESEQVIIVPHNEIDFDAVGSALAITLIAKKFKKPCHIVVNDPVYKIDYGVQLIMNDAKKDISIINKDKYLQIQKPDDLFVLADVNKSYLVSLKEKLTKENTIVIDHHDEDQYTVETEYKYIDTKVSSCCEIVTKLLCLYKIRATLKIAEALLAGIYLDTNKLAKNASADTMKIIAKLLEAGANMNRVSELFAEDFISDRRVQELVSLAKIATYSIAVVKADEAVEYTKEELAKVADYLLKYKVDAAFAIGNIGEGIISISARSKEKVNVGAVMQNLEGGGNQYSAATKLTDCTIEEAAERLLKIVQPPCYIKSL